MTIRDQALVATMVTVAALGLAACGGDAEGAEPTNDVEPPAADQSGLAVASEGAAPGAAQGGVASPSEPYATPTDQGAVATPSESKPGVPDGEESGPEPQQAPSAPDQPDSTPNTDSGTQDEPDPPSPDEEQEEPSADERHAMAAYQESWDATFEALDPPRELPKLEELLTGEALTETRDIIESRAERGTRVEGSLETHPTVVSSSPDAVVLDDCGVENSTEYDADGEVVDMADNAAYSYRVLVVHDGSSWKAAEINRRQEFCSPA
jgi:hypothetical protein